MSHFVLVRLFRRDFVIRFAIYCTLIAVCAMSTLWGISAVPNRKFALRGLHTATELNSAPDCVARIVEPSPLGTAPATVPVSTGTNLALNRAATQSSVVLGGVPARAVDGNTDGNWVNNSVTHTDLQSQAWWQVDLSGIQQIQTIQLWNRTDCCSDRLRDFYVFVSDQQFTSTDLNTTLSQTGVSNYYNTGPGGTPTTITVNRTGRYVRVQLAGSNYLHLAEVQVWGTSQPLNVALASNGGIASASSEYASGGYPASGTINGDRKGIGWGSGTGGWNDNTGGTYPDWLQVDFSGTKTINEIDVFTLQDSFSSPSDPTPSMTFAQYGITNFEVQYWNGASWIDVSDNVVGNSLVWRKFAFADITTNRIRVLINNALGGFSRITEVEAYQSSAAPTPNYGGWLDGADCNVIGGWAWDSNQPNTPINVDIYDGSTLIVTVPANQFRQDLQNAGIGNGIHGFTYPTPLSLKNGLSHTIYVKVSGTTINLSGSPKPSFTCNAPAPNYGGWLDGADCNVIGGWAWDSNQPNTPINVDIYDGSTLIVTVPANQFRQDLQNAGIGNGIHGYSIPTPASLMNGAQHSIRAKFSSTVTELSGNPKSVTCNAPPPKYDGWLDGADCNVIGGWAWDSNQPNTPINVDIYDGSTLIVTVPANQFRQDLQNAGIGNGIHGFTYQTPLSLKNGLSHTIYVKVSGTTINLSGSPKPSFTCGGSTNFATAMIDPVNRTGASGEDLFSGNYNWSLPLVGLPGRAGLDLGLSLTYNSLVWTKAGSSIKFDADNGFPSPGFRLGFPVIQAQTYPSQAGVPAYLMIMPSGSRVELRSKGNSIYESADSSYIQFNAASNVVRTSDGAVLTYQLNGSNLMCTSIKDRNGNFISASYVSGMIGAITDTLGRVVTFNYSNGNLSSITQTWGNNQTHTWATFSYQQKAIGNNFPNLTVIKPTTISALTEVHFADNSFYRFDYDASGYGQVSVTHHFAPNQQDELANTTYATNNSTTDCPRLSSRQDFAKDWNNNNSAMTSFQIDPFFSGAGIATLPDQTQIEEDCPVSGFNKGLPTQAKIWSAGSVKKTTATTWIQDNPNPYPDNPRVADSTITDDRNNQRKTLFTYTTFNLVSDVFESDGSTVLRKTHTDYLNYDNPGKGRVIGLPNMVMVCDGTGGTSPCGASGTLFSKVGYTYDDNYPPFLQNQSEPVQHDASYGTNFITGRGNLTEVTRWDVNTGQSVQVKLTGYNTTGNPIFARDAIRNVLTISYADSFSAGTPAGLTLAYPTTITDGDNFSSTATYHYDLGVATKTHDPKGAELLMEYNDPAGRLTKRTYFDSVNSTSGTYARFEYANNGTEMRSYALLDPGVESFSAQVTDGAGRTIGTVRNFPGSTGAYSGQKFIYDVMGRLYQQSNPAEISYTPGQSTTPGQSVVSWTPAGDDAATGWVYKAQTYDWKGRPLQTTNQDGTSGAISYGGCGCAGGEVVTSTDEVGRKQIAYQDVLGRVVKTEVYTQSNPPTVYSTTTNTYNVRDQLTLVRQYQGPDTSTVFQDTTMTYDGHGRLSTRHSAEQQKDPSLPNSTDYTSYSYYPDDAIQSITDARGAIKNFTYYNRPLVKQITYTKPGGGTASGLEVDLTYDAAGNRLTMTDSVGNVGYTYDTWSRLTSETRIFTDITSRTFQLTYGYNLAGEIKSVGDPFGGSVSYGYDGAGQLSTVTGSGTDSVPTYISGIQYRAWGAPKSVTYGNTRVMSQTFTSRLQVQSFNVNSFLGARYDYYPDGRISFVHDNYASVYDSSYSYDPAGRLYQVFTGDEAHGISNPSGAYRESFGYDVWDNMTIRNARFWTSNRNMNASYTNNRNPSWSYDADGRLTQTLSGLISTNFFYDPAGQMSETTSNRKVGGQTQPPIINSFDGDGQQAVRTGLGNPVYFVRSSVMSGQIVSEVNVSGAKQVGYVYANGEMIAKGVFGQVSWKHFNPVTRDEGFSPSSGLAFRETQLDPLGNDVGLDSPDQSTNTQYPRFGDDNDLSGGCSVDLVPAPCSQAIFLLNTGAGERINNPVFRLTVTSVSHSAPASTSNSYWSPQFSMFGSSGFIGVGWGTPSDTPSDQGPQRDGSGRWIDADGNLRDADGNIIPDDDPPIKLTVTIVQSTGEVIYPSPLDVLIERALTRTRIGATEEIARRQNEAMDLFIARSQEQPGFDDCISRAIHDRIVTDIFAGISLYAVGRGTAKIATAENPTAGDAIGPSLGGPNSVKLFFSAKRNFDNARAECKKKFPHAVDGTGWFWTH